MKKQNFPVNPCSKKKKKKRHMGIDERGILATLSTVAGSACAAMGYINNMLTWYTILLVYILRIN